MMNENKFDYDKCRLCLVDGEVKDFTPIFNAKDDDEISLAVKIMVSLSLPIQEKDLLPRGVCKICEDRVKRFYAFREICYDSYYSLLQARASCNVENKFSDGRDDNENPDCGRIGAVDSIQYLKKQSPRKPEETSLSLLEHDFQDVPESHENLNNLSLRNVESITDSDTEGTLQNVQSESAERLDNLEYKTNRTQEICCEEEKFPEETNLINAEPSIDKYKCLACGDVFSDLDTASIHCANCPRSGNEISIAEQLEAEEYLDENYKETEERRRTERMEIGLTSSPSLELGNGDHTESSASIREETNRLTHQSEALESKKQIPKSCWSARKTKLREKTARHACPDCDSFFSSPALLRRHSVVHTGERPYECSICKKRFSQVGQLNFHRKFHDNPRYRCDVCKKPFLRPSDIEKHMRTHTGEKPYGCVICSKSFAQLVALQQHERIHTGDKPYDCEICGKKFSQKANKTKHVKIHKEGAKPHTCEICGRSFSDIEEMNLHRAGHGGGKPRKCNYCEESFRKSSELAQHIRRYHTFERPHKCAFCQKAFYSLYNLKQHVMMHTGQKPYACSHCDLRFTQKGNLTKHFVRKHMDRFDVGVEDDETRNEDAQIIKENSTEETTDLYACSDCDMKFNDRKTLILHLERSHSDCRLSNINYIVIKGEHTDECGTEGVLMIADNSTESASESLIIDREETVEGEELGDRNNLQIYEIA